MALFESYVAARDAWLAKWDEFVASRKRRHELEHDLSTADAAVIRAAPEDANEALAAQQRAKADHADEMSTYISLQSACNELRKPLNRAQFALQAREAALLVIESPSPEVIQELDAIAASLGALSAQKN